MNWLAAIQTFWPIAVVLAGLTIAACLLWLKTQLATKAELKAEEEARKAAVKALDDEVNGRLSNHAERFERGSGKFADHDRRIALVENECAQAPSRNTLQGELSQVAQRLRGVEEGQQASRRQLDTANDYLKIIVEKGFKP